MATLNAQLRDGHGKNAARALRRSGRVPAVLYGGGAEARSLSVETLELERLLASISGENTLIDLTIEGEATPARALIREVQRHPYKPIVLHLDFYAVRAGEKIRLQVPVRLIGTAVGVSVDGGVLDQVIYDLDIECLPADIPEAADLDVSQLAVGESLRVSDIALPNVTILNDAELSVVSVVPPTVAKTVEEEEAEAAEAAEPEVVHGGGEAEAE
jgi:large subunit ribosomal protein L25